MASSAWADGTGMPFECGGLAAAYGPYDYRVDKDKLTVVEVHHFNSDVENLRKGLTGTIGGDLGYVLRTFPNHHRAMMSLVRLSAKTKKAKPDGAPYSTECFMLRAEAFRPDDVMVKVIHGIYLLQEGQASQAVAKLKQAQDGGVDNANVAYNIGLAYFQVGKFDLALENAHKAYQLGFPLPGLRDKLKRAGKWRDLPAKPRTAEAEEKTDAAAPAGAASAPQQ